MRIAFTDRELDIMAVLWKLGSATVTEVKRELRDPFAYTTVLTVLRTLEEKGYVSHDEDGRAHRYKPLVDRHAAGKTALKRMLATVFGGSPEMLMTNLVQDQNLTPAQIRDLRQLLEAASKPKRRT